MRFIGSMAGLVLMAGLAFSADWEKVETLPGIDFSVLTVSQKAEALKVMREMGCTCGCAMKVAQCRVEDPACSYSTGLAGLIVKGFKDGKNADQVKQMIASTALGHPREPQKVLEDPVRIETAGAPVSGPAEAKIELVEFSDFECPFCAKAAGELRKVLAAYPNDVKLVYKQFPLSMHPHADMAAMASLGAQEQGKFWDLYYKMFANYRQLSRENLIAWAQQLGLNMDQFQAALDSAKNKAILKKDLQDGEFAGVNGTPAIYINGKHFNGAIELAAMKPYLDAELKAVQAARR